MTKKILTILSLILIIVSACAPAKTEFTIVDQAGEQGETYIEAGRIDNSAGTEVLVQDASFSKQYIHSIDLNLNRDTDLSAKEVRERILEEYNLVDSQGEKTCVFPVEVPAGVVIEYDMEWTEEKRTGLVVEGATGGGASLGEYSILVDLQCQVVGQRVIAQ
jgi:hypothetical protein